MHEVKMASVTMKKYVKELQDFLASDYLQLGHPGPDEDDKLKALTKALQDLVTEIHIKEALDVMKTALCDEGWLRGVLSEHEETSAPCERALELCVKIYEAFQHVTSVTAAPDQPLCGKWKPLEDDDVDEYLEEELDHYCDLRRLLRKYASFLLHRLTSVSAERQREFGFTKEIVNPLYKEIEGLPRGSQLVGANFDRGYVWYFHTSYLEFSSTNRFSRSALLANVSIVMTKLQHNQEQFMGAFQDLPDVTKASHRRLYNTLLKAYKRWQEEASLKIERNPVVMWSRTREVGQKWPKRTPTPKPQPEPEPTPKPAEMDLSQLIHELRSYQ